jgi:hypothetical protein
MRGPRLASLGRIGKGASGFRCKWSHFLCFPVTRRLYLVPIGQTLGTPSHGGNTGSNPVCATTHLQGFLPQDPSPGPRSATILQPKCAVLDGARRVPLRLVVAPCPPRLQRLHAGWRRCPADRRRTTEATELTEPTNRGLSRTTVSCGTLPLSRVCGGGSRPGRAKRTAILQPQLPAAGSGTASPVAGLHAAETGLLRSMTIPSQTNQTIRPIAYAYVRSGRARTERMPATPVTTPR